MKHLGRLLLIAVLTTSLYLGMFTLFAPTSLAFGADCTGNELLFKFNDGTFSCYTVGTKAKYDKPVSEICGGSGLTGPVNFIAPAGLSSFTIKGPGDCHKF